jgi:putative transposase
MRIKATEFIRGQYYHLYNRCVAQRKLFVDSADYSRFLVLINDYLLPENVRITAYCLMPNHFHLLLHQVSERPLFLDMNRLTQSYSKYFNKRYQLKGALWANKLQHIHIPSDKYFLRLCAYIHSNPLKANLVTDLKDWQWSNYPEWIGIRNGKLFDPAARNSYFKDSQKYVDFINALTFDNHDKRNLIDYPA